MSHWIKGCPLAPISGNLRAMGAAIANDALDDAIEIGLIKGRARTGLQAMADLLQALRHHGALQGLLRMANLPFVGSPVLGSAVAMDKDVTKRLLRDAGLSIAPFVTLTRRNRD